MKRVLAFDFGASSGRAMLCTYDGSLLSLTEAHRFSNTPVTEDGTLWWDTDALFREIGEGVRKAQQLGGFDSIAFDTWGVDFGLIGEEGLLERPVHYRDERTAGMLELLNRKLGGDRLYSRTGIQQMEINTVFQLYSLLMHRPNLLQRAQTLLMMPDLFGWLLTGNAFAEITEASTTGLLNPVTKDWDWEFIQEIGLPERIFPPIIRPGTIIGSLKPELCAAWGVPAVPIVAAASHDTASAVAAIPADENNYLFLSCGTWSLIGTELETPVIDAASRDCDLTNEVGYGGITTFLKNIIGLWLIQETRRQFQREGKEYSYADMERLARESDAFYCFVDPDAPDFVPPGDIPDRIRSFCRRTGQPIPETDGAVIRCIYESLALKYRFAWGQLRRCTGRDFQDIHLVGGGTKDGFLCQMTADATGLPVIAGPIEATALGNASAQLIALGALPGLDAARGAISQSFEPTRYTPSGTKAWNDAYQRFEAIL